VGEAAKKDDEEKLIPVGPGAEGLPEADKEEPKVRWESSADKEKDEDEPEDTRLAQKDEDADGEPHGERKKESAKQRRERAKKAHARDRLERDFFMKRNEDLEKRLMAVEGRTAQTETAAIDQRINTINAQLSNADRVIADALKKPNGGGAEEFIEAQRIRDQLRDQLVDLTASKKTHQQATQHSQRREPEGAKPDARVIRNAREWAGQHDWFDFNGTDEDSVIVKALDEAVAAEGFDPSSDDYWEELTARVKRRLPEKFKGGARERADEDDDDRDDEDKPRRQAGPKFSSGGRERPLKKGEVYVSAERKQAMKDYGVWEDPVSRNRMLKKYAKWDADIAATKS
jgi:hypothetical protein